MPRGTLINSLIGDYRLDRFIGAGGMGEVYRGVHARLGRAVAVKVLSPEGPGATFVQRFWHEARLHATLHHPNIVELYDFIEFRGQLCIVMEYVEGETLADRVRQRGPLPPAEAIEVFRSTTAAVAYLHAHGIVHRDIKSANVRLAAGGGAKLLDFGIAKNDATPALTSAGAVIGTLVYLAPEQLGGAPATARSDVWALGLLLYEMLTGRLPFAGDTAGELLDTISRASYERASRSAPAGPAPDDPGWPACDRIIARCLRRDPGDRFENAGELLRAIEVVAERPARESVRVWPLVGPAAQVALASIERYWAWIVAAAAVVLLVVLVAPWFGSRRPASPPGDRGAPGATGAEVQKPPDRPPAGRATPMAGGTVHRIEVVGGSADVYIDGEFKGRTPFEYSAADNETIRLELRQQGFISVEDTFDVTARPVWTFVMRRAEGRHP